MVERPSVCPFRRSAVATAAGGFATEHPVGRKYRSIAAGALQVPYSRSRHSAANAGSVTLTADG